MNARFLAALIQEVKQDLPYFLSQKRICATKSREKAFCAIQFDLEVNRETEAVQENFIEIVASAFFPQKTDAFGTLRSSHSTKRLAILMAKRGEGPMCGKTPPGDLCMTGRQLQTSHSAYRQSRCKCIHRYFFLWYSFRRYFFLP